MYIHQNLSFTINSKIVSAGKQDAPDLGDYQFFLVQQGSILITCPEHDKAYTLQKKDCILMDPKTPFFCSSRSGNTLICVRLDALFIDSLIPQGYVLHCNSALYPEQNYSRLGDILSRICSAFYSRAETFSMLSLICELADELKRDFIVQDSALAADDRTGTSQRMDQILDFLSNHYNQSLTLGQLAEELYLTPQYLSRFIRAHFQTSFTLLLTQFRLDHAYAELMNSKSSITNIAINNGFSNASVFNKAFRAKYELSPSAYRQKYGSNDIADAMAMSPGSDMLPLPLSSSNQIEDILVNSLSASAYHHPWNDTINIGPLKNALTNSFHENFIEYQSSVPVKYVRFFDLFSLEVLPLDSGTEEINFSNLDVIMNFFYFHNIIPFIELGRDHIPGLPPAESHARACRLLPKVLSHCQRNYGSTYLNQWRFEIWWRVDEELTPLESPDEYIGRYETYMKIIRSMLPVCTIGGPSFNMCGKYSYFTDFILECATKKVPFDFITLAAFSYEIQSHYKADELTQIGIVSPDPDHILNTFSIYAHLLHVSCYTNVPIYISELGSVLALDNHLYESIFQAAFLCKNMLGLGLHCDCIAYNYFLDTSDYGDAAHILTNTPSLGLISTSGVPKPSLHAYHFLSMLGKSLILQGNNYILTASSRTRYQLLCYHYTHFDANFCFDPWANVPMEKTYSIFPEEAPLSFHFTCSCLPPGRYKVTQLSLNRGYGSALDKYLRILEQGNITSRELLSIISALREDEVAYYKRTSIPRQDIFYFTSNGYAELNCSLEAHEIVFYEMQKVM